MIILLVQINCFAKQLIQKLKKEVALYKTIDSYEVKRHLKALITFAYVVLHSHQYSHYCFIISIYFTASFSTMLKYSLLVFIVFQIASCQNENNPPEEEEGNEVDEEIPEGEIALDGGM